MADEAKAEELSDTCAAIKSALNEVGIIPSLAEIIYDFAHEWMFRSALGVEVFGEGRHASYNFTEYYSIPTILSNWTCTTKSMILRGQQSFRARFSGTNPCIWIGLATEEDLEKKRMPSICWYSDGAKAIPHPKEPIPISIDTVSLGSLVSACDTIGKWNLARIDHVDEAARTVRVHYIGWGSRWDHYLLLDNESARLDFNWKHHTHALAAYGAKWDQMSEAEISIEVDYHADTVRFTLNGQCQGIAYEGLKLKTLGPLTPCLRVPNASGSSVVLF